MLTNWIRGFGLTCAGWLVVGCTEPGAPPAGPTDRPAGFAAHPGEPGAASDRMLYQVQLRPVGDTRAHGVMHIEIIGGFLAVSVHAAGLEPLQHIPQHIHVNPTCNPGGGILINLDAGLNVAGEAPSTGAAYPLANAGGVVNYYASRSLTDLLDAVNSYFNAGLTSVEALLTWLDLENRNGHMHIPTPPFTPVDCGPVERLN